MQFFILTLMCCSRSFETPNYICWKNIQKKNNTNKKLPSSKWHETSCLCQHLLKKISGCMVVWQKVIQWTRLFFFSNSLNKITKSVTTQNTNTQKQSDSSSTHPQCRRLAHTHTSARTHAHARAHGAHTHAHCFLWFMGTLHRCNGFVQCKLYVLLPYTYP